MLLVIEMEQKSRKPNRLENFDYSQNGAYFITICTRERRKILSEIVGTPLPGCPKGEGEGICGHPGTGVPTPQLLPYGEIADKYIRQIDGFYHDLSVDKYVIMPDHIHLLITICKKDGHPGRGVPTRTSMIARFVGTFKRFCNREYGGNIWQSRYYDHVIRNQQDYNEVWEYIENNPVKWLERSR